MQSTHTCQTAAPLQKPSAGSWANGSPAKHRSERTAHVRLGASFARARRKRAKPASKPTVLDVARAKHRWNAFCSLSVISIGVQMIVEEVMSREPYSVTPQTSVREALRILFERDIRH